jgi:hypothetical protein
MALELTSLDRAALTPAVQKAITGPARVMAARGVMPLPSPGELATALYELGLDEDPSIATAARGTMAGLPDKVLAGVFADAHLDPRVLDWISTRALNQAALFDALIRNPAIADATVATLAGKAGDRDVEQIATNEQRLLRHPEIIAAMYTNPNARMSTVDRAVELAVRNDVRVPGLAAWDEIARALDQDGPSGPDADARFAEIAAVLRGDDSALTTGDAEAIDPDESDEHLEKVAEQVKRETQIEKMGVAEKIRTATIGNAFARAVLVRDVIKMVALAAIKSPAVSPIEATRYAGSSGLDTDVIRHIAGQKQWTRLYAVKLRLSMNPKTPVPDVSRMLPHLRDKDLVKVSKSKGVSSAVVAQARKLISQRSGKK